MKLTAFFLLFVGLTTSAFANEAPVLSQLEPFEFIEGQAFVVLKISQLVSDSDHSLRELEWSLASDVVWMSVMGTQLYLGTSDPQWVGVTTFSLTVCDPEGACDTQTMTMTVAAVNDPPELSIPNQVIAAGESFASIVLGDFAEDSDDAFSTLTWEIQGAVSLDIQVVDGVAQISVPSSDWTGVEYVTFSVCDPAGACVSQVVLLAKTDGAEQVVYRVGNAGFIVESQSATVAVDALFSVRALGGSTALMRTAEPPFDVDLILVTHSHSDSFSAQIVAAHMAVNGDAKLVGPIDVIEAVRSIDSTLSDDRFFSLNLQRDESLSLDIDGIQIDVGYYPHGPSHSPLNIGYLFELDGKTFFHAGDLDVDALVSKIAHPFAERMIDFAFVDQDLLQLANGLYFVNSLEASMYIPACFEADTFRCDCSTMGMERLSVLCLTEGLAGHLLPTE
jgi:L-ascorbate metabolism protein UlaG (beta-lactamase superfamily)